MEKIIDPVNVKVSESVMNEAHQQKQDVIEIQKARNQNTFEMGAALHKIKLVYEKDELDNTYNGLQRYGFQFYNELLRAPEESGGLGISTSSSDRSVRLHRKYVLELNYPLSIISKFNYTKLDIILKAVTEENVLHWLKMLQFTIPQDLARERDRVLKSKDRSQPGDSDEPITTAIIPTTARDWIEVWDLLQMNIKESYNSPQDKKFIKEVYSQTIVLFKDVLKRKARGTEFKRSSEKLIKVIDSIVQT